MGRGDAQLGTHRLQSFLGTYPTYLHHVRFVLSSKKERKEREDSTKRSYNNKIG